MDFGGGLAVGIAIGMGSGMATGIGSRQTQNANARKQLDDYIEQNQITIQDRYGKPIKSEEFVNDVFDTQCCSTCPKGLVWGVVAVGVAVLVSVAAAYFFMQ